MNTKRLLVISLVTNALLLGAAPPAVSADDSILIAKPDWSEALKLFPVATCLPNEVNTVEGVIQTSFPILLGWDVSMPKTATASLTNRVEPELLPGAWLEFPSEGQTALVHLRYASWPRAAWGVRLEILDADGKTIHQSQRTLENSGTVETFARTEESVLKFDLGTTVRKEAVRFRLGIASLWAEQGNPFAFSKQLLLRFGLSTAESSGMFRAHWLTVNEAKAEAVVHAQWLSWPKCRWRVQLNLVDEQGRPAGRGETIAENSGFIAGYPMTSEKDIGFTVTNLDLAAQSPRRFTLRVERLLDGGTNSSR